MTLSVECLFFYLAVHPAQSALLYDEVTGRLQEVGSEVTLLDVIVLIATVSGPGPGPEDADRQRENVNSSQSHKQQSFT